VGHWWIQRLTAIALAPLSVWFVFSLLFLTQSPDPLRLADWLSSPLTTMALILMLIALFWHAKLGVQVVVEDYVHAPGAKFTLLILNSFGCFVLGAVSIMAVLKIHLLDLISGF
jgi:succinate dehydrogenase / fumarate reductase membrane anchor subunit